MKTARLAAIAAVSLALLHVHNVGAKESATTTDQPKKRTTVFISDTHMGLGKNKDGQWSPLEDFRWPNALRGFLADLSSRYENQIDLVVLGDFLELWQPVPDSKCSAPSADAGCTEAETLELARFVINAHQEDFKTLDDFISKGDNKLFLVAGNHDASILLDGVWHSVQAAFPNSSARVTRSEGGLWTSGDKRIVAEHGHQIGKDVNRYPAWPTVSTTIDGTPHVIRPWGEQFVQKLFNSVEADYPIIDNLSPESLGARYRLADKGLGRTAKDLAQFIRFNLFETSRRQVAQVLRSGDGKPASWDLTYAKSLGAQLVVASLPKDDEFSSLIGESSDYGEAIRKELAQIVDASIDDELTQLCDLAAMEQGTQICIRPQLGHLAQSLLNSKKSVLEKHLLTRRNDYPAMSFFVYGHTHQYETPWDAELATGGRVTVANTGAFQRVINAAQFEKRRKDRKIPAADALRSISHDDLPACYTFVVIEGSPATMRLYRWLQSENSVGRPVSSGSGQCD